MSFQYIPTSPLTDDFVIATGTVNVFGSGTYGLKVDFTGDVTQFDPIITTSLLQSTLVSNSAPTFQVSNNTDLQTLISAVNGLIASGTTASITVNLSGGSFGDVTVNPPAGVTVVLTGNGSTTTIVGHSPALTVSSGTVIVEDMAITTDTDSPSILVLGGDLILRDDTIQENTGGIEPAIALAGGALDLGIAGDPGNNTLNITGLGEFVQNTTGNAVPAVGDTFEIDGTAQSSPSLTFISLTSSTSTLVFGQAVTFTLTAVGNWSGGPADGTVTFLDGSSTLGTMVLSGGVASLTTSDLAEGEHTIIAIYGGSATFLGGTPAPQLEEIDPASTTTTVTASANLSFFGQSVTYTATVTAASGTFDNGGTVQFAVDGSDYGGPVSLSGGSATIADATLGIGTPVITASYSGDTIFGTSSGTLSGGQTVDHADCHLLHADADRVSWRRLIAASKW